MKVWYAVCFVSIRFMASYGMDGASTHISLLCDGCGTQKLLVWQSVGEDIVYVTEVHKLRLPEGEERYICHITKKEKSSDESASYQIKEFGFISAPKAQRKWHRLLKAYEQYCTREQS